MKRNYSKVLVLLLALTLVLLGTCFVTACDIGGASGGGFGGTESTSSGSGGGEGEIILPNDGDEDPDGGDENPDKGDENPDSGDENPDGDDENPDGGDENPDKGDENPDSGETKENEYEHIIVFYSTQGDILSSITKKAIEKFEKKYPGWKIQHVRPGGYYEVQEAVQQALANGKQPDIVYCYPDHVAEYLYSGKVVDLNKYISSTEKVNGNTVGFTTGELNDFVASYYNQGKASNFAWKKYQSLYSDMTDESMLMLPFLRAPDVMYYNKTALDACGLTPAKTWDELWKQCETILAKYPYCTPVGIDSEANLFMNVCKQNGWKYTSVDENTHYLFNGTEQAAWLNQLRSYYVKGYFTTQEDYGGYTSGLFTRGVTYGDNGCVYCIANSGGSTHHHPYNSFTWGVSAIPGTQKADGSIDTSACTQGPSLVMLSGGNKVTNVSEKEKMTFLFMKELLDPEFQSEMSKTSGYNPVRQSAYDCDYLKELLSHASEQTFDGIVACTMTVCKDETKNQFTNPAFEGSLNLTELIGNAVLYSMWGNKTGEVALKDAYDEAVSYVRPEYTPEDMDKPRQTTIRNILESPEQFYDDYDDEGAKVEFYAYLESLTVTSTYKFVAVDIEDSKTYKIDVYAGYASSPASKMKLGHVYRIVGTVQKYQGNLQISGISYSEEPQSDDDTYLYRKDFYLTFSSDEKYTDNYSDTLYSDATVVSSSVSDGVLTIVAQAYKKIGDNKYASTATNFVFYVEVGSDYENVFTVGKTFSVCGYQIESDSNVIYILDYSSIVLKS